MLDLILPTGIACKLHSIRWWKKKEEEEKKKEQGNKTKQNKNKNKKKPPCFSQVGSADRSGCFFFFFSFLEAKIILIFTKIF